MVSWPKVDQLGLIWLLSVTTLFGSSQESTGRQAFWCPKKQGGGIRLLTDIRPILLTLSYRFKGNSRLPNQV